MLAAIQKELIQIKHMNLSKSGKFCGILICPIPISISRFSVALRTNIHNHHEITMKTHSLPWPGGSVDGVSSCTPTGCGFHPLSGWVWEATLTYFSLSLSLSLSQKKRKKICRLVITRSRVLLGLLQSLISK